jgi:PAS domain S-box-containing protein
MTVKEKQSELRQRALAIVRNNPFPSKESIAALSSEEIWQMLHELRVRQIELEMQNVELRRAELELDASRSRYFELYDLAPVGYCTVSETTGQILQVNLAAATLLGVTRSELINRSVMRFIFREDQDTFYRHRKQLMSTDEIQWCDLRMLKNDGTSFWAQMSANTAIEVDGTPVLRIMLNDISERKRVEAERVYPEEMQQHKNVEL